MGPKGFSVSYTRDAPAGSALEPANDPKQEAKQEAKKPNPMAAFTDSTAMPTGAMRRMDRENGESFIMYGYFVPLAANLTRHFVMFARSSDKVRRPGLTDVHAASKTMVSCALLCPYTTPVCTTSCFVPQSCMCACAVMITSLTHRIMNPRC